MVSLIIDTAGITNQKGRHKKMIEINTQNLDKAIAKARTAKPLVKVIEFRTYQVTNKETGATYTVKFSKVGGKKFADCSCKCGLQGKYLCYHIGASIGYHVVLSEQMAKV
jgi:hypothetical protein